MGENNISEQQSLVIVLEDNAMDSLVHGIEHYLYGKRKSDWKYVILHVFHAVELFLKARLAKYEVRLIYSNRTNGHTVSCVEAINRLVKEVNIPLDNYVEQKINANQEVNYKLSGELEKLRQARNDIEHKEATLNKHEVDNFLGIAFRFLDDFVSRELGMSLEEELEALDEARWEENSEKNLEEENTFEQDSYKTLSLAHLSYVRYMSDRGISLHPKRRIEHSFFTCEACEEEAVVLPDPRSYSNITYCYNCRARYEGYSCARCEQSYIEFLGEWEKGDGPPDHPDLQTLMEYEDDDISFCPNCLDWMRDQ
jgi:hypothetical protein